MGKQGPKLVLASASRSRQDMLNKAGVACAIDPAHIDEDQVKKTMTAAGAGPAQISERLAIDKAMAISPNHPGKIILGADQLLVCDGKIFDKPSDMQQARDHLRFFRGKTHQLLTSYALVQDRKILVTETLSPRLTMRDFSEDFLENYLEQSGEHILSSVGCYLMEGLGSQLFSHIDGDYFTILGLPLINLLEKLRKLNILAL